MNRPALGLSGGFTFGERFDLPPSIEGVLPAEPQGIPV